MAALPKVGSKVPAFKLTTDDGGSCSLTDLKGQRFVLFAFPKAMTSGCTAESIAFRDALSRFKSKKVAVLGLSHDSPDRLAKFKDMYGLNFPLLSDEQTTTLQKLGIWQQKSLYGRKFMGTVRTTLVVGPNGQVEHVFPKVKVNGHVGAVLDALDGKAAAPVRTATKKSTRKKATKKATRKSKKKATKKKTSRKAKKKVSRKSKKKAARKTRKTATRKTKRKSKKKVAKKSRRKR